MTRMHLMWFCAFSPHAGFGLDGWAGPGPDRLRVDTAGAVAGHGGGARARQVRPDHARGQPRRAGDLPGTDGRLSTLRRARALSRSGSPRRHHGGGDAPHRPGGHAVDDVLPAVPARPPHDDARPPEPGAHRVERGDVLQDRGGPELRVPGAARPRPALRPGRRVHGAVLSALVELGSGRGRHGPAHRHLRRSREGAGDRLRGHVLPLARPAQRHAVAAGASRHHPGRRLGPGAGLRGPPRRGRHRRPGRRWTR